jgi:6-phosphofructokinase 2
MKPIVTLTLNPTIDGSASADVIAPVRKIRTSDERYHPGGGGINVARVVQNLGGEALALYLAGGATGAILDDLLETAKVRCQRIPIAGYTRIAHTVFERSSGQEYRFVPEGPEVSGVEWNACLIELATLDFDYVVASGSLPRGLPETAYVRVIEIAAAKGARVVLDTSGPALTATLGKGIYMIKPNRRELEDLVGRPLPETAQQIAAARALIANNAAKIIAITLGSEGALIVNHAESWHTKVPSVTALSAVGAGDSFVGAVTLALAQKRTLREILAYGVAAGTAAVLSPGAELSRVCDVDRLYTELLTTVQRFVETSASSADAPAAIQSARAPSKG